MTDLVPQHLNGTDRWEVSTKTCVRRIDTFRKNKPDTVVLWILNVISQHQDESVTNVDRESGKHPAHFGIQRSKRIQHKRVRRFRLGKTWHRSLRMLQTIVIGNIFMPCSRIVSVWKSLAVTALALMALVAGGLYLLSAAHFAKAVSLTDRDSVLFPYLYPVWVRGRAYMAALNGIAAAHLELGRAYALSGDNVKARASYQNFLTLWKDADPDIPILIAAKSEYAKLQ